MQSVRLTTQITGTIRDDQSIRDWITFLTELYTEYVQDSILLSIKDRLLAERRFPTRREIIIITGIVKDEYISSGVDTSYSIALLNLYEQQTLVFTLNKILQDIIDGNIIVAPSDTPTAPQNIVATPDTDQIAPSTSIVVTWSTPIDDGGSAITGYRIERETPIGGGYSTLVADTGDITEEYTDNTVLANTEYRYRISAINANGVGLSDVGSNTTIKLYVAFPIAPIFTDATAITTTTGGKNIDNTALASKLDATMSPGQTANISTTFTVGTKAIPVRFKSLDPAIPTIIGDGTVPANPCFRASGSSRHVQLFDFTLYGNQGGISWPGNVDDTNSSTIFIQNVESHRHDFAGYWVNTANGYYDRLDSNFYRYFELDGGSESEIDGGEGLYIGHTTISTRSKIFQSIHRNLYGIAAARDGVQVTGIYELEVSNATIRNSGTWGAAGTGQNRLLQDHSTWGKHTDCIYDGSPSAFEIQGTNKLIYNCLFKYMNGDRPFIGGFSDGLGQGEPQFDTAPIIFDSDIFKTTGTGALLEVQTKACDVIVRNCIISDTITSLFMDSRGGGATNNLIDGGGNVFLPNASIPDPVYAIEPQFNLHITYADTAAMIADQASQTFGRRYLAGSVYYTRKPVTTANIADYIITLPAYVVTDDYYYNRGMGYRSPRNVYTPIDITISVTQIAENNSINDVIASLGVVGGSGAYTFTVQDNGYRSGDSAAFNTSGSSLRASVVFDEITKSQYYLRIRAASVTEPMRYLDKIFDMSIVAEPTIATDIILSSITIEENEPIGTIIGVLSDDATPSSIYTLVSGTGSTDNAKFSISGSNLIIEEIPDYETQTSYAIRIRSTNLLDSGMTFEKQFTISVIDEVEGLTAEYTAILNEATTQGYTLPTAGQQTKQNQVILDLINSGVWAKLDRLWVLCTDGSSTFTYINWKNPTGAKLTLTGSPVFTANSGWRANGNTHYVNSNFIPSTDGVLLTQNDGSMTIGIVAPTNGSGTYCIGAYTDVATSTGLAFRRFNSNVIYSSFNSIQVTSSNTFQNGDFAVITLNREDSAGYGVYRNKALIQSAVATSTALPAVNVPIGAVRNESATIVGSMSSGVIKFVAFGGSLNSTERDALNDTMTTYTNSPS